MRGKCDFFDAEPFEHASFSIDAWNEWEYKSPVLVGLLYDILTRSFYRPSYFLRLLYLDMIQIKIFKSYSPQLRLMRLVFTVLYYQLLTFLFLSIISSSDIMISCNFQLFSLYFFGSHSNILCLSESACILVCRFLQERLWNVL